MRRHLKISAKRLCAVMLAVLITASALCIPVFAETEGTAFQIPDMPMTITVPEDAKIISIYTYYDEPIWAELGILDPSSKGNEMVANNILAEIYADDGNCVIAVAKKESDLSKSLYNLNNLTEQDKAEFLQGLTPATADGSVSGSAEWYEHEQVPFFRVDIQSSGLEANTVYERLYGTVFNGVILTFDLYNGQEPISEEYDALMRGMVDSAVISEFMEKPEFKLETTTVWGIAILLTMVILLVSFVIYRVVVSKREKKARRIMADRIAKYHQSKKGREDEGDGALRFVNETMHDDATIKVFANYQAFHHNLFLPIFTVLMALVAIVLVMQFDISDNWWMIVALVVCVGFSVYKSATSGTVIAQSLIRVFSKMRSRKAVFYFYDGDFRITGLQASNLHPYFQITRVAETKDYFYLYFGEGNTYFIKKDGFKGFEKGKGADEFRAFLKEKLEESSR